MEIDITSFFNSEDPYNYSASAMELGPDAGPITWGRALRQAEHAPLLTTPEQLEALREHMAGYGAWDGVEINGWSDAKCNAMFIQEISADMRDAGMGDCFPDEFDWDQYAAAQESGTASGVIYLGDDGHIYYFLDD